MVRVNGTVTNIAEAAAARRRAQAYSDHCEALITMAEHQNSALLAHARRELPDPDGDENQAAMNRHIESMVSMFALAGHQSEFLAGYAAASIGELIRGRPLTDLTGADEEWTPFGTTGRVEQNIRMPSVFRLDRMRAWWENGFIFQEPMTQYTASLSRRTIEFPWTPCDPVFIEVPPEATEAEMRVALRERGFEPFEMPRIVMPGG